jgi:hypothetical protein
MMAALLALGWTLAYLYCFWLLYVLIMGFYRAHLAQKLSKVAFVLALPAIVAGFMVDLIANWTLASLWFREWPQRPLELVTDRLSRYIDQADEDWKKQHANWVCKTLLDYFDPHDRHCGTPSQTIPATKLDVAHQNGVTDEMVSRFLQWPVPASVYPDGTPGQPGRTGTNLLDAATARQMLERVLTNT